MQRHGCVGGARGHSRAAWPARRCGISAFAAGRWRAFGRASRRAVVWREGGLRRYPRLSALETGLQRLCPLASAWRMDALLGALLSQQVRAKADMRTKPSVVIIDFQSVKTTQKGQRGYGAGKKIKG